MEVGYAAGLRVGSAFAYARRLHGDGVSVGLHAGSHAVGAIVLLAFVGGEEKVGPHAGSPAAVLGSMVH